MLSHNGKPTWLGRLLWGQDADLNGLVHTLNKHLFLITQHQQQINWSHKAMSAAFDRLKVEVAETEAVILSVIDLLAELAEKLRDAAQDEVAVTELADDLDAKQVELQAVIDALKAE